LGTHRTKEKTRMKKPFLMNSEEILSCGQSCFFSQCTTWKPGFLYLTKKRLIFSTPSGQTIFQTELEKLTDVKLAKRKFILGLRRDVLHIVFENISREKIYQVFFAVNNPKEWKERICKAANFVTENVHTILTDILEEKGYIKVLTKIPDNVNEKGLMVVASEDTLTINGNASNGRYHRTIELPALVRKGTVKATCKGKILEVNLEKLQTWHGNGRIESKKA